MGKGDKRSKRGKIWRGSFGNSRPKAANEAVPAATKATGKKASKKTA